MDICNNMLCFYNRVALGGVVLLLWLFKDWSGVVVTLFKS